MDNNIKFFSEIEKSKHTVDINDKAAFEKELSRSIIFFSGLMLSSAYVIYLLYYLNYVTLFLFFAAIIYTGFLGVHAIVQMHAKKQQPYWMILVIAIACLLMLFFQPLKFVGISLDYNMNETKRETIVKQIENGSIQVNAVDGTADLPKQYAHLSKYDGVVSITVTGDKRIICFFTSRALWKVFPAIVYVSGEEELKSINNERTVYSNIKKLKAHWYLANITNKK